MPNIKSFHKNFKTAVLVNENSAEADGDKTDFIFPDFRPAGIQLLGLRDTKIGIYIVYIVQIFNASKKYV